MTEHSSMTEYWVNYWRDETEHSRELLATATEQLRMTRVSLATERCERAAEQQSTQRALASQRMTIAVLRRDLVNAMRDRDESEIYASEQRALRMAEQAERERAAQSEVIPF